MERRTAIILGIIVLVIAGGFVFLATNEGAKQAIKRMNDQEVKSAATNSQSAESPNAPPNQSVAGTYVDYNEDSLATAQGTKVLFFHAPWCPQCRSLEADIKKQGVPNGTTILKVDYDTNQDLRRKYGVSIQTTLVKIDKQGNLVKKYVAYDEPTIAAVKANLL